MSNYVMKGCQKVGVIKFVTLFWDNPRIYVKEEVRNKRKKNT